MKILDNIMILIATAFIVFGVKANACSTRTVAELDSCKVKDRVPQVLQSIRPDEEYVFEPRQDINDTRNLYERLSMNNKPTLAEMRTALDIWKDAQRPKVQFREDMSGVQYFGMGAARCGFGRPNAALLKRDIIKDMDQAKLTCLKEKDIEIQAEIDDIASKRNQEKMKRQALKDYDCSTETGYAKLICEHHKLRF